MLDSEPVQGGAQRPEDGDRLGAPGIELAVDLEELRQSETAATEPEEADWIAADVARRIAAGDRARDHAVLVRTNAAADAILRSLNLAGIPWRFTGTSGLLTVRANRRAASRSGG